MNENDTSHEAYDEWYERTKRGYCGIPPGGIYIWREAVHRCEANPWQFVSFEMLESIFNEYPSAFWDPIGLEILRRKPDYFSKEEIERYGS